MSLDAVTLELNEALVRRLYDDQGGHYLLMRLTDGHYRADRVLGRGEALTYRCAADEILRHVWPWVPRKQRARRRNRNV